MNDRNTLLNIWVSLNTISILYLRYGCLGCVFSKCPSVGNALPNRRTLTPFVSPFITSIRTSSRRPLRSLAEHSKICCRNTYVLASRRWCRACSSRALDTTHSYLFTRLFEIRSTRPVGHELCCKKTTTRAHIDSTVLCSFAEHHQVDSFRKSSRPASYCYISI